MVSGKLAQASPGEILLVRVVLLQDREPLQFGIRLGERQDRGIARRDRLHFGIGEFLAADVLGAADRDCRRS